jgi:hypothetical protein
MIQVPHFDDAGQRARAFALGLLFEAGSSRDREVWKNQAEQMAQFIIGNNKQVEHLDAAIQRGPKGRFIGKAGPEKGQPKTADKRG